MRYTLDENNTIEKYGEALRNVLDNGSPTEAYARPRVSFSDNCEITGGWFHDGVFNGGEFRGGWFRGGEFRGGEFRGGVFHDGWFHDGWFRGGMFRGGVFHDGVFNGGVFNGGVFRGGVFRGGEFHDGVFNGGVFRGGVFRGGVFRGGWLPLQIQGSSLFVNIPNGINIKIGCQEHGVDYWLKNYERIGKIKGYSDEQIAEYKLYIDLAATLIERNK